jgi:hypothetical protein
MNNELGSIWKETVVAWRDRCPGQDSNRETPIYCNESDQRVIRQQLCKHGPTRNNRGSCVFCRSDRRANSVAG